MNSYNEFATIYDELMNDFDYKRWADYIESIFEFYHKKPNKILEMACGTGNLTYQLAKRTYNLVAFDLSSEMLTKAYEKLYRFKNVKLLNQDMTSFELNKKFDSIISICDSINYILDIKDLFCTFTNVYNHLEEDGIFIFDINSFYKLEKIIGNNIFIEDRDDVFYTWQNEFNCYNNICSFYLTFFINKDDRYYRFDEEHEERAYNVEEITDILYKIGFKKIEYFDCFTFNKINPDTERINFIAIK
ncbi:class I SAM-dependent DNA methyltransferase [Paratissierella segnis]|jgi:ubiquinone/menaquinone biosynthesis C-methylase UbiE|uniref:Class I SAM-dependent methyltransferase n=1 Tax=Paratissierella segnis TaxID=2763679 RepID=A0A926IKS5_9FIRM|nr:class I SAM-dependent methyltransferase [Paratissierella segnis]MBC8589379.1 class I SAM-dependent methyltransferase [Paratissierella segnis]